MSSSALIFFWGINREFKDLDLHNILFSNDYKEEFKNIFEKNEITNDPTIYINITSKDIKNVSPKGCENWFVMINSPKDIGQDWDKIKNTLRKNIIEKINKNFSVNIQDHIVEERVFTPKDISINTNSYLGSLYGESSNGILSPLRRHQNFSRSIKNLYFCGGTVHPGGGIPLCIMSSKIVSDLIEKSN
jgi:phytoene dehydrogenase-like protein